MLPYDAVDNKVKLFYTIALLVLALIGIILIVYSEPKPKKLEDIRTERLDKFHEAGKDGNAFIKGLSGK